MKSYFTLPANEYIKKAWNKMQRERERERERERGPTFTDVSLESGTTSVLEADLMISTNFLLYIPFKLQPISSI